MKTIRHITCALAIAAMGIATAATAQKLPPTQVPAPVMQAFTKDFPNAMDVEWKLSGTQYKVEFETGLFFVDHEVWYDASGRMLRHEEEISASDLPAAVVTAINTEFPGYRVDDVERITMDGAVSYVVELKMKGYQEWKAAFDPQGKLIDKRPD
jgi:hypothetical protein